MTAKKMLLLLGLFLSLAIMFPASVLAGGDPPDVPHPTQGREDCTSCHWIDPYAPKGTGLPANHAGRTSDQCLDCHGTDTPVFSKKTQPAAGSGGTTGSTGSNPSSGTGQQVSSQPAQSTQSQQQAQQPQKQPQQQPAQQTGKLPTAGENDFQFLTIAIAAAAILIGGIVIRKLAAAR